MTEQPSVPNLLNDNDLEMTTLEKLYSETARISWLELQRFFAQGVVINVDAELDLLNVAVMFAQDQAKELQAHVDAGLVQAPSNEQAKAWYEREAQLWSVVVAPFVLVQDKPISAKEELRKGEA